MRKIHTILSVVLLLSGLVYWQIHGNSRSTASISNKFDYSDGEKKAKPEFPGKAAAYWEGRLKTSNGQNPALLNWRAKDTILKKNKMSGQQPPMTFESFGPGNFGGRVRSIVIHPDNPDLMLTAGVSGGVWKSENGGMSWGPQSDFLSNIAISSMIIDPDTPNIVYLGTGEGFFGWGMARGLGIFKSQDFGVTWHLLSSTANSNFHYVNRLVRVPGTSVLMAATREGLFRSPDSGQNWTEVSGISTASRGFVDLKIDPSDPNIILASHYGNNAGSSSEQTTLRINSPASIASELQTSTAEFGPSIASLGNITGDLVLVLDDGAETSEGCGTLSNGGELNGKIALVNRGTCQFVIKVKNAQNAGAIAVVVVNNIPGAPVDMGGSDSSITIPTLMISQEDGSMIKPLLDGGVNVSLIGEASTANNRFISRSTDAGHTFEILTDANGLPTTDLSRMEIGWGTDGVVYVSVSNEDTETLGLWRSTDHGLNYTKTASTTKYIPRQGWYDLMVGVDPSDSDRVYLGAIDVYRSVDAGARISRVTTWSPSGGDLHKYVHADIHAIAFHPQDPQTLWIGTDGGLFKSTDGGLRYTSLNNDLRIAQNYGLAVHPNGQQVITGTQDNGSHIYFGEKDIWLEWYGGDGGFCAWDQQEPEYVYGSLPNGGLFGSSNMGSSSVSMDLPSTSGALFIQPFTIDPNNGNRLMVGTDNVYFTTEARKLGRALWTDVSGTIGSIYSMAFSPHDGEVAYVATTGGNFFKTTHISTTTEFDLMHNFPGVPTSITVDKLDSSSQTCHVTLSAYAEDRIMKTVDGGETWSSIHGNLPQIPVHCLSHDPLVPGRIFIGTELGLFVGHPAGESYSWELYDYGIAWTRVTNLEWGDDNTLWAATYGRGTYRISRNPVNIEHSIGQITGDGDVFLDAGESHLVRLELQNRTPLFLDDIEVSISTHTQGVTVLSDIQVASISAGQMVNASFIVQLDTVYESPTEITLEGILKSGSHNFPFHIPVTLCGNPNTKEGVYTFDGEMLSPMVASAELGETTWHVSATDFHSGSNSIYAEEDDFYSLKTLQTPEFDIVETDSVMTFWLSYNLEGDQIQRWDGLVLEVKGNDGQWRDLGANTIGVPYDGMLMNNNALYLRDAWSGNEKTWREAVLDLSGFNGQRVSFRFRLGCDTAAKKVDGGAWVDDFEISGVSWQETPLSDTVVCTSCSATPTELPVIAYLPYIKGGNHGDTTVTVMNPWEESAVDIEIVAFNDTGLVLSSYQTELDPNAVFKMSLNLTFPDMKSQISWIQLGSSLPVEAMADVADSQSSSAYLASSSLSASLYVPHVAKATTLFETHLLAVNGMNTQTSLNFISDTGDTFQMSPLLAPYQQIHTTALDVLQDTISNTDWGSLTVENESLAAMEFFTNPGSHSRVASLGLNSERGTNLRFLHIAGDTQLFWTGMVYFNTSSQNMSSTESYYDAAGNLLTSENVEFSPFEKRTLLFDHTTTEGPVPSGAAWMEVSADQEMVGYELFGSRAGSSNDFFAGLQGSYSSGRDLVFQTFVANDSYWTGLVILNVGQSSSTLTLHAYNDKGVLLESMTTEAFEPKSKSLFLSNNLFSETTRAETSWVKVVAAGSEWDGFSLWGDHGSAVRNYLAGVRAIVR